MTAKRLIKIGKRIRVHSRSFVAKNIFLKAIFSILDPRSSILDPLRFLRFFVAGLLALLLCVGPLFFQRSLSSAEAQTLRERHARLRAALDRNDQAEAESLLGGMLANNPEAFALNNYDYLLARFVSVPLDTGTHERIANFLENELGTADITAASSFLEEPLRSTLHVILSLPEYQLG